MARLDIKALTDTMREFDGQVTAKGLSSDMGISYSTFARANRTGVWPRSLADGSVLSALDESRMRYFGGNGQALAEFVIAQLGMRGVATSALEEALGQDGYDSFAAELLAQAHEASPDGAVTRLVPSPQRDQPPSEEEAPATEPTPTAASFQTHADGVRKLVIALPTAVILLLGVLKMSLSTAFSWAADNRLTFLVVSMIIALLPALVGALVDAPLAWRTWRREHPDEQLTWHKFRRVAKYGAPEGVVAGAGRFNLTLPYLAYQPVCNLASAMCYQSLLALMLALPGFTEFFCGHEWTDYLKVGIFVSYWVAWEFLRDQCRRPLTGNPDGEMCENPDNYLPSRAHVWANTLHLVLTISFVIVGLLGVLAYSIANFRTTPAPAALAWPYAQGVLFFAFSSLSPYAVKTRATGIGVFVPAVVALSAGFFCLASLCYLPSAAGTALCIACVACPLAALAWAHGAKRGELAEWLSTWSRAGAYPAVIAATVLGLLVLGFATFAFA